MLLQVSDSKKKRKIWPMQKITTFADTLFDHDHDYLIFMYICLMTQSNTKKIYLSIQREH